MKLKQWNDASGKLGVPPPFFYGAVQEQIRNRQAVLDALVSRNSYLHFSEGGGEFSVGLRQFSSLFFYDPLHYFLLHS